MLVATVCPVLSKDLILQRVPSSQGDKSDQNPFTQWDTAGSSSCSVHSARRLGRSVPTLLCCHSGITHTNTTFTIRSNRSYTVHTPHASPRIDSDHTHSHINRSTATVTHTHTNRS